MGHRRWCWPLRAGFIHSLWKRSKPEARDHLFVPALSDETPTSFFHSGILERFPTEPMLLLPYSHAFDGCVYMNVCVCVVCVPEENTAKLKLEVHSVNKIYITV